MIDDSIGIIQMMDFPKPHSSTTTTTIFFDSDSEEEDLLRVGTGSSLPPSFGTWNSSFRDHVSSTEACKNRNGGYDRTWIAKINQIMEENERSVLHAVEVASARVTQLDSRTRRLEDSMDDLKVCVEYNQGRTGGKLRELESSLKEVQMNVKFLLDKQEIAETKMRLLKLNGYRAEPEPEIQNLDVQTTLPQQTMRISSGKSYQPVSAAHTSVQPATPPSPTSAYPNLPHLNFTPPQAQVGPSTSQPLLQHVSPFFTQASELSSPSPHESYHSTLVHHQALSVPQVMHSHLPTCVTNTQSQYTPNTQRFGRYPNSLNHIKQSLQPAESGMEQEQSTQHSFRVSDRSSAPADTNFLPQSSSFSGFPDPSNHKYYDNFALNSEGSPITSSIYSSQVLPNALPKALFLDTQSGSSGEVSKASNEDIVEEVTAMGFRRDMVIAAVRKLTQRQEAVDLNTLLDKLMN